MTSAPPAPRTDRPHRAGRSDRAGRAEQHVWRVRLLTACLLLTAASFLQGGGRVVPDTKLDLTLSPAAFLGRALHVWDAGHLGQLQNQAYGYLFPMGPFHLVLRLLQVPEWVTQRLWWSLVLCTAFLGFWRLARAVGVGGPWTRYLGALLFALSPRFLAEIAVTSIEVWPMAVAPWVLLPLVDPAPQRTRRRILRSALAFGCIGGVNAIATGAALVLPTLWWLTRERPARAVRGLIAWLGACVLAGLWWIGPLVVLGRYSPPFLDWIENAAATTSTASPYTALQGTTHWLSYLRVADGPTWPAGWVTVTVPVLVVTTTVPAIIGLVGLTLRGMPDRSFWRLGAVVGLVLLVAGFGGPAHGPFAGDVRALLDGSLAPFRNIHKFELVLRIPLMLGLVHAVHAVGAVHAMGAPTPRERSADDPRPTRWVPRELVAAVTGVLVVAAAAPAVAAMLPRAGAYEQVADYWREVAGWLDDQPGPGTVLVVPAAPAAELTWGSPRDEPLQALMRRPFAVRDAVPLGSAGSTRYLDEVERHLRTGVGGTGLRGSLRDAGIRYLVVRNDLRVSARRAPGLAVHQALADAGIARVRSFGPPAGSAFETADTTVDERTLLPYPSLEVYDVGDVADARLVPVSALRQLTGGPEDLPSLGRVLPAGVAVLGSDRAALPASPALPEILTDGNQRRETIFGRASDNRSPVLRADDPGTTGRRVQDYVVDPTARQVTLRWEGIAGAYASSSGSDAGSFVRTSSGDGPAAALDGDPTTRWTSGRYQQAVGEWFEVRLDGPRDLTGTTLTLASPWPGSAPPVAVDVTTDAGTVPMPISADQAAGATVAVPLPAGPTTRLRLTLRGVGVGTERAFAISELTLPGIVPVPRLVLPPTPSGTPDVVSLRRQEPGRTGCLRQGARPLCAEGLVATGEEAAGLFRSFTTTTSTSYAWSGHVRARPTAAGRALLDIPGRIRAEASTSRVPGLAGRPGAAVDDDLGTGWVASELDRQPTLRLTLPAPRALTGVRLLSDAHLAASRPRRVQVRTGDGRTRNATVAPDGTVAFTARTDRVDITVTGVDEVRSIDAATKLAQALPVGVSEVVLLGAEDLRTPLDRDAPVGGTCGDGPTVRLDGVTRPSRLVATVGDVLDDRLLRWVPCGGPTDLGGDRSAQPIPVAPGEHRVTVLATSAYVPESLLLTTPELVPSSSRPVGTDVVAGADGYAVPERAAPAVLALPHNANAGWVATDDDGHELTPVRLDGRRQGWVLPAGPATVVHPRFAPQRPYAALLVAGALGLLLVAAGAWREGRRQRAAQLAGTVLGSPPLRSGAWSPYAVTGVVAVLLPLATGPTGLGAVGVGLVVGLLARRARRPDLVRAAVVAGAATVATALVAARPWGAGGAALLSWWPQAAVLTAVAAATVLLPGAPRARLGATRPSGPSGRLWWRSPAPWGRPADGTGAGPGDAHDA